MKNITHKLNSQLNNQLQYELWNAINNVSRVKLGYQLRVKLHNLLYNKLRENFSNEVFLRLQSELN